MGKDCDSCKFGSDCRDNLCRDYEHWKPKGPNPQSVAPPPDRITADVEESPTVPDDRITAHAEWYRKVAHRLLNMGARIALTAGDDTGTEIARAADVEVDWYISVARHFDGHARNDFAARLAKAQKDLPPDIAEAVAKHFWDLV